MDLWAGALLILLGVLVGYAITISSYKGGKE